MGSFKYCEFPVLNQREKRLEQIISPSINDGLNLRVDWTQAALIIKDLKLTDNSKQAYVLPKIHFGLVDGKWMDSESFFDLKDLSFLAYLSSVESSAMLIWREIAKNKSVHLSYFNENLYFKEDNYAPILLPENSKTGPLKFKLFSDEYEELKTYLRIMLKKGYLSEPK